MTNSSALIIMKNVEKRYGRRLVLVIDDFTISSGDRVLLLGRNGSGKSTLLRLLAGISRPSSGKLARPRQVTIGYAPQAGGLYPDMTLRDNLAIFHRLYGGKSAERLVAHQFIGDTGLGPLIDVQVGELSGGFRKLAALACVLASSTPEALLLDEPTADLDEKHASLVIDVLQRESAKLAFLVVSSHPTHGLDFLKRRVFIENGRIT